MRKTVMACVIVASALAGALASAQVTSKHEAGAPKVTTAQVTGEVLYIEGNYLLAKLQPSGQYRGFNVKPGQEFVIDGQKVKIGDLKTGTVLTGTAITTERPMIVRTHNVLNGTVWWVAGNYVVLTDDKGQNREYSVPESYNFTVEGKPASVHDLKKGMKVQATKIVEEPVTEISTKVEVTGKAPK